MTINRSTLTLRFGCLLAAAMLFAPGMAAAEPTTYSLTPEQKAAILDAGTENGAEAARAGKGAGARIHGEVGGFVGTSGARGAYGTAAIPLGDNAGAIISFEKSRFGDTRRR